MRNYGKRIKTARIKMGLTQGEVAKIAGCSTSYISAVERGERKLDRPIYKNAILTALGLKK